MRCLRSADLTDAQKANVKAFFDAARPGFDADVAAIRSARTKLRTDTDAGADKSVIGQDFLDTQAASRKLRDDHAALRDRILGTLSGDQKARVQSCLDSRGGRRGPRGGPGF